MSFKVTIFVILALASASDACQSTASYGERIDVDELLWSDYVETDAALLYHVVTTTSFTGDSWTNITAVKVIDTKGYGACVNSMSGGVGYSYLSIELRSSWSQAIGSTVEVYGYEILV